MSLMDGKLSVMSNPGDEQLSIMSRVNTYNDGRWHYISIMKKGREYVSMHIVLNLWLYF